MCMRKDLTCNKHEAKSNFEREKGFQGIENRVISWKYPCHRKNGVVPKIAPCRKYVVESMLKVEPENSSFLSSFFLVTS